MNFSIKHSLTAFARKASLVAALGIVTGMASANPIHVSIDTSQYGVSSGYIDMQLSASTGVPLVTATVSNLVGFNTAGFIDAYGVTPVASGYVFRNDTLNDLFHAANFGGMVSFDLQFNGTYDPFTSYVSRFVVAAFDENFAALGQYDPVTGALANFSWTPPVTANGGGTITVEVSDSQVSVVPEPAGLLLMATGLCALVVTGRRRSKRRTL